MTPTSRFGAAESNRREGSSDEGASAAQRRAGSQLRLLLSLEHRESTRTRLLVTEVLGRIIQDIVDAIPGQVRRHRVLVSLPPPHREMKNLLNVTTLPPNRARATLENRCRESKSMWSARVQYPLPTLPRSPPVASPAGSSADSRDLPPLAHQATTNHRSISVLNGTGITPHP